MIKDDSTSKVRIVAQSRECPRFPIGGVVQGSEELLDD